MPHAVSDAVDSCVLFGGERNLIVVTSPEKGDVAFYEAHLKAKDPGAVVLLHLDGEPKANTKFGKFVAANKKVAKNFPMPSQWNLGEAAAKFAVDEARRLGYKLDLKLASEMVVRVGYEFAIVANEIAKMALLAEADGSDTIGVPQVKEAMAELAEADLGLITVALAARNKRALAVALARVHRTSKDDPTIRVCRFLGATVLRWLPVVSVMHQPPDDAAAQLGLNPWFYKNKLLPQVQRWGKDGVARLVHALAESERGVLDGHLDPWTAMMARLLNLCG